VLFAFNVQKRVFEPHPIFDDLDQPAPLDDKEAIRAILWVNNAHRVGETACHKLQADLRPSDRLWHSVRRRVGSREGKTKQ
jgi:hypothetical protein